MGDGFYATATVSKKEFSKLLIELEGIGNPKNQKRALMMAGDGATEVIRDATIRRYRSKLGRLDNAGGSMGDAVINKATYKGKVDRGRSKSGNFRYAQFLTFNRPGVRLVHLFDHGFTPNRAKRPYTGWNIRKRVAAKMGPNVQKVFFKAMREMLDTGGKKGKIKKGALRKAST